ncbi:MAG: peroxiredoxin family protein [Myxococcota bacterium]|nr:peroxiredoxin family protein [Myxococcota bacterium]
MAFEDRPSSFVPVILWAVVTLAVAAVFPIYLVLANFEGARPWVERAELWSLVVMGVGFMGLAGASWLRSRSSAHLWPVLLMGSLLSTASAVAWVEYVHVRSSDFAEYTRLDAGDLAPDLGAEDHRGESFNLADWPGPVVLVFYRGQWCPFCYRELQALKSIEPRLRAIGGVIVAVSRESAEEQLAPWQRDSMDPHEAFPQGMRFVADPEGTLTGRYGLEASTHGREVARPMLFVVNREGRIHWRSESPSWRHRPEPEEVLRHAEAAAGVTARKVRQ